MLGVLAERAAALELSGTRGRRPHQMAMVPIYGKTGRRRARRSSVGIFHTLELAEHAQQSAAVVRASSGSHWLAAASSRLRGSLYVAKTREQLGTGFAYLLVFDGMSISGLNIQSGAVVALPQTIASYFTPKAG